MLMIEQAPSAIAAAAVRAEVIDSSRQIGVRTTLGQLRVPEHVLLRQRLLDQQQVELVQLRQVPRVLQGVGGVRVHLDQQVVAEPLRTARTGSTSQPGWILSLIRT